jgi:6-phosphogluconolactonase (cycloisomerase 2 family)
MRNFRSIRILVGITVTTLVADCGGGGGGGDTPAPSGLSYPTAPTFLVGQTISPLSPKVTGTVSTYSVSPALPAGLTLNGSTGVISGTPTGVTSAASYKIEASNSGGNTIATIILTVSSRFLYASGCSWNGPMANPYFTGGIYGFSVDLVTGVLNPVPGSPFAPTAACSLYSITLANAAPIAVTHDSKFLYSVDSAGKLLAFLIQSDGSLSAVLGAPFTVLSSPESLVAHPKLDLLYGTTSSGTVLVFTIDSATGAASLTSSVDTAADLGGSTLTPDGRYYYQTIPDVFGSGNNAQIAGFSTNGVTGALSSVPGSPLSLGSNLNQFPQVMAVDPAGKFLYVSNGASLQQTGYGGPMHAYSIDPVSGALTDVPGSPFGVSQWPQLSVAVDASDRFLIVPTSPIVTANCLVVSSINPDTGALTSVPGSPFDLHCGTAVTDPSEPLVYMAGEGVDTYSIDLGTGTLNQRGEVIVPGLTRIALTH